MIRALSALAQAALFAASATCFGVGFPLILAIIMGVI
jgi:hypothetical protein